MVDIGDDVRIGHFNTVRHVARLVIGRGVWVSNLNAASGNRYTGPGWTRTLVLGDGSWS